MKKRILKKARIQLQICIPLLCIGILAAGVLIVKNLSWAEISMAAVGTVSYTHLTLPTILRV